MTRAEEIAWAAGLFEGEGCIAIQRFKRRTSVSLTLTSTDRDVLERFALVVERGRIGSQDMTKRPAHYKQLWIWKVGARADVEAVLDLFWAFLGERRRATAIDVMGQVTPVVGRAERQRRATHCRNGHSYENNVYWYRGYRQCRTCRRENAHA